jgi:signal transduction histidine kinase
MNTELEEALAQLADPSETIRLAGARVVRDLSPQLTANVERAVSEALARESVPWVRGALAEILASDGTPLEQGVVIPAPSWDEQLQDLDPDVARRLINTSTRRVLHEVAAVVGRTKLAAGRELGDAYLTSDTRRELEFLSDVCAGLRTLSVATQAPSPAEFDLSGALDELATSVRDEMLCPVVANGPAPFITVSDRTLLVLAARNILTNAVEATLSVGPADEGRPVVLTWGSSASGTHATVIDRGPGPPAFLAGLGRAGVSTKIGHPGYGLATASEALRSLGGEVQIQRNERAGTTVILAWPEQGS